MTLEQALAAKLAEVLGHTRIYPDGGIPQGQKLWPCVVYDHVGDDDRITLAHGRARSRVDVYSLEIVAKRRTDAAAARDALKAAFAGYNARGVWGGADGVRVTGAVASEPQADADEPFDGAEDLDRVERLTLRINWRAE